MFRTSQITEYLSVWDEMRSNCFSLNPAEPENTINTRAINAMTATNSFGNANRAFPWLWILPRNIPATKSNKRLGTWIFFEIIEEINPIKKTIVMRVRNSNGLAIMYILGYRFKRFWVKLFPFLYSVPLLPIV